MRIIASTNTRAVDRLVARDVSRDADVAAEAARIVADVRRRGDRAVLAWSRKLDGFQDDIEAMAMTRAQLKAGWAATPRDVRVAIRTAISNVRKVAEAQTPRTVRVAVTPGLTVTQHVAPLARVGCYVPGGRYPLPSTLVMTVVPAKVAGVPDVLVTCPSPAPAVLCAALEAGADRLLRLGGAQAIGAMAYGTASIPRVDKIVGPGNAWVAAAKSLVSRDCPIDVHAGPSEIVVWSDEGRADWIALDLLAQAEHDPAARAVLVTTRAPLARAVATAVRRRMPADGPAREAIRRHGAVVVARTRREAIAIVNRLAPEHLVVDRDEDVPAVTTAGTIFVGPWSVQAAGDYATGSNHVLPTGGAARFRGGLTTADFVRTYTVQSLTRRGLATIASAAITLAEAEGLTMHAQSIAARSVRP